MFLKVPEVRLEQAKCSFGIPRIDARLKRIMRRFHFGNARFDGFLKSRSAPFSVSSAPAFRAASRKRFAPGSSSLSDSAAPARESAFIGAGEMGEIHRRRSNDPR
jgi:hypothetical protein